MKAGDRVELSDEGRRSISNEWGGGVDFLLPPDIRGTVVRPGVYRGGTRVHILVDGDKLSRSFASKFWKVVGS